MRRTAVVLVIVSALAAGCSDDGDSDSGDSDQETPIVALTADQITEAVLQPDNMGDGWTSTPSTEEDDTEGPGCFGDIDTLTEGLTKETGGTEFAYGDTRLPLVESTVTAYDDEPAITAVFDQAQTVLGACSTIADTDGDGATWDLALTFDDSATFDDVDDQFQLSATGSFTQPDSSPVEIAITWTSVRLGPNVASVTTIDTQQRTTEHAAWAEIAFDRLEAVAEGEEPEATTAPAPA